jgi:type IV secretory pathway VirB10-like protein
MPTGAQAMMDNSLLWGIILIGVGLALALIAYAVMLNRREAEGSAPAIEDAAPEAADELPKPIPAVMAEPAPVPAAPAPAAPAPVIPAAAPPPPTPLAPQPPAPPTPREASQRLLPVAALLREDVSGALVVQVGERTYRRADDLRKSPDWARVQSISADLARWTSGSATAPRASASARDETPAKAGSMIDQINEILEKKLLTAGNAPRGVRLAEGPGGTVRVFVGVQAYSIDEVPDPAIRLLIRQAVSEWEASG